MISIKQILTKNIELLKKTSSTPRLDAEIILSTAISKTKEFLYTHPEHQLTLVEIKKNTKLINRRLQHEPIAYILGQKEFYGLNFLVNKNTLIPRPETEIMVELILQKINQDTNQTTLIDIGTGSGCIPISVAKYSSGVRPLAKESNPFSITTFALDISTPALRMAKTNAKLYQIDKQIKFYQSDLLSYFLKNKNKLNLLNNQHLIITANLPYIPTKQYQILSKDIKSFEPKTALTAGSDGLKYYKQLFKQLAKIYQTINILSLTLIIEIDPSQDILIKKILKNNFDKTKITVIKDLRGLKRVMIINLLAQKHLQ